MLKTQKNLTDLERSGKLKENNLIKELQRLKESQEDIKRRHKNVVRELSDVQEKVFSFHIVLKNLKLKAHCTSLFIQ